MSYGLRAMLDTVRLSVASFPANSVLSLRPAGMPWSVAHGTRL